MKRRVLSILLSVCMLLSLLPIQAFAASETDEEAMERITEAGSEGTEPAEITEDENSVFTVTFNANGHGEAPDGITVSGGGRIAKPSTDPKETGWSFGGWYKEKECEEPWDFDNDTVIGDLILYAGWTAAEEVPDTPATVTVYYQTNYNESKKTFATETAAEYTIVSNQTEWGNADKPSIWVVNGEVSFEQITCTGDVTLILMDGCKLTVAFGIILSGDSNSLTICAGNTSPNIAETGSLIVYSIRANAAIGGNPGEPGQNITINGGTVTAFSYGGGAAIGGGEGGDCRNITINGGIVNAQARMGGAAIGGGSCGSGYDITINNGIVTATGNNGGAGIGGGDGGDCQNITIKGGNVTATGYDGAAGIGGGNGGHGNKITINGDAVTATGYDGAAGIGGGYCGNGSYITINGGTVNATGNDGGAGIGGGSNCDGYMITINGGNVLASGTGYNGGAGIGGGCDGNATGIEIAVSSGFAGESEDGNEWSAITSGTGVSGGTQPYFKFTPAVARIGGIPYGTLAEAIAAAEAASSDEDSTVKLIADVDGEDIIIHEDKSVILDLNGFVLKGTGNDNVITNNGTLTIKDSNSGKQSHNFTVGADTGLWSLDEENGKKTVTGGVITSGLRTVYSGVRNYGTLNIDSGTITGNSGTRGGGVYNQGTLNMFGGTISGNAAVQYGGGVYNLETLNMYGGTVSENTADYSGGVYNNRYLVLYGGEISGNKAKYDGGGVINNSNGTLTIGSSEQADTPIKITSNKGDGVTQNVVLNDSEKTIAFSGAPKAGSSIGITLASGAGVFAANAAEEYQDYFFSDSTAYEVRYNTESCQLELAALPLTIDLSKLTVESNIPGARVTDNSGELDIDLIYGKFILVGDCGGNGVRVYNNAGSEIIDCSATGMVILINNPGGVIAGGTFGEFPNPKTALLNYGTITGGTFSCNVENEEGNSTSETIEGGIFLGKVKSIGVPLIGGVFKNEPEMSERSLTFLTVSNGFLCGNTDLTSAYIVPGTEVTVTAAMPEGETFSEWSATEGTIPDGVDETSPQITFAVTGKALALKAEAVIQIVCIATKEVKLSDGRHELRINNKSFGTFTFTKAKTGWSIQDEDGYYLAVSDGKLVPQSTACYWTYSSNCFRCDVTEQHSTGNKWIRVTWTQTTSWYLTGSEQDLAVSKSSSGAKAKFYDTVTRTEHDYSYVSAGNGKHKAVCTNCGEEKTEACSYDEATNKCVFCGSYNPEKVNITVSVKVTEKTGRNGICWWSKPTVTYQAAITVSAEGSRVKSVEYSQDGKHWTSGTTFSSSKEITTLYIRVTDAERNVTYWTYENGAVNRNTGAT